MTPIFLVRFGCGAMRKVTKMPCRHRHGGVLCIFVTLHMTSHPKPHPITPPPKVSCAELGYTMQWKSAKSVLLRGLKDLGKQIYLTHHNLKPYKKVKKNS